MCLPNSDNSLVFLVVVIMFFFINSLKPHNGFPLWRGLPPKLCETKICLSISRNIRTLEHYRFINGLQTTLLEHYSTLHIYTRLPTKKYFFTSLDIASHVCYYVNSWRISHQRKQELSHEHAIEHVSTNRRELRRRRSYAHP